MSDGAVPILLRHLVKAEADRRFHLARHTKGNLEAMLAGHKSAWLRDLIREIGGPDAAAHAEIIRRGGGGPAVALVAEALEP